VAADEVDDYLAGLDEPRRSTLTVLRGQILQALPDAEQGLSYGVPVFRIGGKNVAGLSAAARHVSYLPHSGDVLGAMSADDLGGFEASKGALRLPVDAVVPQEVVDRLIAARRAEAGV